MKSPWKFLLDLASSGRTTGQPESASEAESEKSDAPSMATDAPIVAPTPHQAATALKAEPFEVENDLRLEATGTVVVEPASDKTPSDSAPDQARTNERADPPKGKPLKRQARGKKSNARNIAPATGVEYGSANSDAHVPPMAFSDEVAALDDDIRRLRRQLAEKLSLQNAQLKKMLERF